MARLCDIVHNDHAVMYQGDSSIGPQSREPKPERAPITDHTTSSYVVKK
jgi:hypothetical protein